MLDVSSEFHGGQVHILVDVDEDRGRRVVGCVKQDSVGFGFEELHDFEVKSFSWVSMGVDCERVCKILARMNGD